MSLRKSYFLLLLILSLAGSRAYGQAAKSPYSSFGLGESYGTGLTSNMGMGGVGFSNPEFWHINNMNPALLVFNRFTTFEAGMIGEQRTQSTDSIKSKSGSGNLNYVVLALPIMSTPKKWGIAPEVRWTTSIALMPYTRLNYQYIHAETVPGTSNIVNITASGSGGINQVVWSNGVSITKSFSIGLKSAYLFSSATNEYAAQVFLNSVPSLYYPKVVDRTFVSDFQFSPAISLHLDSLFGADYRFSLGVVYDFKANLSAKLTERVERWGPSGIQDSTTIVSNYPGTIAVPSCISGGISFGNGYKWTAAVDGSYADYTQYRGLGGNNPYVGADWRVAAGFEIIPEGTSLTNYLKRTTYRTGVSIENYPYLANGNTVKDLGISFGLSAPVGRLSYLNMSIKFGKKGDKTLNTIEENYIKLYFGVTLNDQWFIKRKFD